MLKPQLRMLCVLAALLQAACGTLTTSNPASSREDRTPVTVAEQKGQDVALFATGLVETGYRFGGKHPEAGLDCSGMVSYVYDKAVGIRLAGSAADIARLGRQIQAARLKPGDLVFFNTRNQRHSHVGIFIGDGRFVHAPNSRGKVRAESLTTGWFAQRFEEGRTYFD